MPISYSIEPTNHCNLKCPECPSGLGELTRPLGLLKFNDFKNIIDQIYSTGFYIQLFFQGEPYINKQLPEMIEYAQSKNMYVSISTNGSFINEKNMEHSRQSPLVSETSSRDEVYGQTLTESATAKRIDRILSKAPDKLIFSIDGLDEETYQVYRVGGTFSQADAGLRLLIQKKKELNLNEPFIELQFIVMKQNEHQIQQVFEYGKEVGVNKVVLKTMQVSSLENAKHFLPSIEKYRRYILDDNSFQIKGKLENHCFALWRTSVITWDGKVAPCCFDKDVDYELGLLNGKSFQSIWSSEKYQHFRKQVLNNRKGIDICKNCTEGMKINILEIEN